MKKTKILSLILAMVMCLSLCLAACDNGTVSEHDHEWDEGVVTTEPSCYAEGVRTLSCKVEGCKQTKTVSIETVPHSWDDGSVTKEPKCNELGERTFNCKTTGCTATRTEPVDKITHSWDNGKITAPAEFTSAGVRQFTCSKCSATYEEPIEAHADFVEQFYTDGDSTDWSYGVATEFDVASKTVAFAPATVGDDVWTATGVEIGAGAVKVTSAKAAIAFTFTEDLPKRVEAMFNVSFKGNGVVKAYIVVVGDETSVITLNEDKAEWIYASQDEEGVQIAKGDKVYLILDADGAVEGALSFTITALCLHVWDQGEVTTEPRCDALGEKTFTCVSCDDTYTQPVDTIPHEWDDGAVTKYPTTSNPGEKTFSCKNCEETQTEPIAKLEFDGTVIANFGEDFTQTLAGSSDWKVGKVDYVWATETFEFTSLNADVEAFKNDAPWMEVKSDWMANDGMVGLAYHFREGASILFNFVLNSSAANNFSIRWALKNSSGVIKTNGGKASWGDSGNIATVTESVVVEDGDELYMLINKEAESANNQCNFSFVVIEKEKVTPSDGISFADDFAGTLAGTSNWEVGTVAYKFPEETFEFTKLTAISDAGDAFKNSDVEIKGDWMAIDTMVGLAYRFQGAASISFNFTLTGDADGGDFSVRWGLKGSDGVIKTNGGKGSWGGRGNSVTVTENLTVEEGDVLYLIIQKEDGTTTNQCHFTFAIDPRN